MRQALEIALEALETAESFDIDADDGYYLKAITAIKEALAQPKQEPVAFICQGNVYMADDVDEYCTAKHIPLYTTPPQRKPLTLEQIQKCYETTGHYQTLRPQDRFAVFALARAIEAAHGIK